LKGKSLIRTIKLPYGLYSCSVNIVLVSWVIINNYNKYVEMGMVLIMFKEAHLDKISS